MTHIARVGRHWELEQRQVLPVALETAFAFFTEPRNLQAITPPWLDFRIERLPERIERGALIDYRLRLFGVPLRWRTEITELVPRASFTDLQLRGPYAHWEHVHRFRAVPGGTEVYDCVRYALPVDPLSRPVHRLSVRPQLERIFAYRAERLPDLVRPPA